MRSSGTLMRLSDTQLTFVHSIAKVGVAGSNPVVRSRRHRFFLGIDRGSAAADRSLVLELRQVELGEPHEVGEDVDPTIFPPATVQPMTGVVSVGGAVVPADPELGPGGPVVGRAAADSSRETRQH
jgi:hypothetical protein